MNRFNVALLLTFVAITFSNAQDHQPAPNQISVSGSVELREIANQASFTFTVKGVGSSLRLAVENANMKVKIVTDKLLHLGVSTHNIATSQFYSGENYGNKAFLSSSRDYQATLVTLVMVDSLPLLEPILYATSESEIENVSNISFSMKDELDVRRRARVAAAMKAKEKAGDMARALNVTLGQVISIDETDPTRVFSLRGGSQNYPNPFNPTTSAQFMQRESNADESTGSSFFAQTITITSQVRVIFEIKPQQ